MKKRLWRRMGKWSNVMVHFAGLRVDVEHCNSIFALRCSIARYVSLQAMFFIIELSQSRELQNSKH